MNYWSLKVNEMCFLYFLLFASEHEVLFQDIVYEQKSLMASYFVIVQFRNLSLCDKVVDISSYFSSWLTEIFYDYKLYRVKNIYASAIFHVLVNLHIFYV